MTYTYDEENRLTTTRTAATTCLHSTLAALNFTTGKQTDITYDSFGSPACVLTVDNEQFVRTTAEYTYTADRKQESCRTTTEYFASDDMTDEELVSRSVTVQTFAYNASGDPVRSESYVEGEEQTSGREVEEHEYDANGYEVRTRTYNTLDPSSCLCTEVKLDENGRTTAEADATGKWETTFSYTPDGAVRSKHLPNGSRLAYGFDRDGSVTAITHSTEEGEENSVTRLYPAVVLSVGSLCCRHFQAGTGVGACRRVCQALFFIVFKICDLHKPRGQNSSLHVPFWILTVTTRYSIILLA